MPQENHFDVIIIGTGAGGGTLAYHLAPSGKRILLLERGGYLPREKDNWDSRAVFLESKYQAKEPWYDKNGNTFHPGIQYYVGGNTKVYGAALLRFRKEDFGEVRHYGGISPAWPLSYEDFEPYYTKAEHLYHVHGEHGIDPTEGPASAPYRHRPVSHEPRIQELYNDLQRCGHHPFPLPLGILLNEKDGKALHTSACVRCAAFDGFPCLVNGKADAQIICVDPALENPNVRLLTGVYVKCLDTDASGRVVTKVLVERDGHSEEYSADHRGRFMWSGQLRCAPAALCQRQALEWAREQFGGGGAPLHAAQQLRLDGHFQTAESDRIPENPGPKRFLLPLGSLGVPVGWHPDA
jgi:choline dehydrogenase-like flavoprotein